MPVKTANLNGGAARPRPARNGHAHATECTCPLCGSVISSDRLASIIGAQKARESEIEQAVAARFARQIADAERARKAEIEKARREATEVAEIKLKALAANQEATISARLLAQRETLEKAKAKAVTDEKVKAFEEKSRLTEQLAEMQRRLERKTAHELGDPAEVDLFEQLVAAFPDDRISRVVKGQKGPDIIVEVVHNDAVVGKVVIDCKNHKRWQNGFTSKLRADQLDEGADFAILSTAVFPAGARQLHIQDNVIVADPARVPVLVHLLRRQIIDNFMLKLGAEAKDAKAGQLYNFILSPTCDDLFDRLLKLTHELQDLGVAEEKSHRLMWDKRGTLLQNVFGVREQFCGVVADIIGGGR